MDQDVHNADGREIETAAVGFDGRRRTLDTPWRSATPRRKTVVRRFLELVTGFRGDDDAAPPEVETRRVSR